MKRQRAPDFSCSALAKNLSASKLAIFISSYERYVRVIFTSHTSDYPPFKFNHVYTETGPVETSKLNRRCHRKSNSTDHRPAYRVEPDLTPLATFVKCAVSACFPFPSDHKGTKTTRKNKATDLIQTLTLTLSYNNITLRKRNARHRKYEFPRLVSESDNLLCEQPFDYIISRQSTN